MTNNNTNNNTESEVYQMSDSEYSHLVLNQKKNKPKIKAKHCPPPGYKQLPLFNKDKE